MPPTCTPPPSLTPARARGTLQHLTENFVQQRANSFAVLADLILGKPVDEDSGNRGPGPAAHRHKHAARNGCSTGASQQGNVGNAPIAKSVADTWQTRFQTFNRKGKWAGTQRCHTQPAHLLTKFPICAQRNAARVPTDSARAWVLRGERRQCVSISKVSVGWRVAKQVIEHDKPLVDAGMRCLEFK